MTVCKEEIVIRELNEGDTAEFLALKQIGLTTDPDAFVASLPDDLPSYPESVRERLAGASPAGGDIILGAFARHLIGVLAITRDSRVKRQHKADLHGMYIVPEYRGHGLGKDLLVEALAIARQVEGLEEIQLIVATHSQAVVRLYERFGFVRAWTESRALKLGDRYVDAHHMVLELTSVIDAEDATRTA